MLQLLCWSVGPGFRSSSSSAAQIHTPFQRSILFYPVPLTQRCRCCSLFLSKGQIHVTVPKQHFKSGRQQKPAAVLSALFCIVIVPLLRVEGVRSSESCAARQHTHVFLNPRHLLSRTRMFHFPRRPSPFGWFAINAALSSHTLHPCRFGP